MSVCVGVCLCQRHIPTLCPAKYSERFESAAEVWVGFFFLKAHKDGAKSDKTKQW